MRKSLLVAAIAFVASASPARAQFCPGANGWVFIDVFASDPFCSSITWMAENGVSLGCQLVNSGQRLYCPNDNVPRNQMAAFISRSFDMPNSTSIEVGTITKPGGSFLHDHGIDSVFLGLNAGNFANLTASSVGVGAYALNSMGGSENSAFGAFTLRFNTQGYRNAALGAYALEKNTSGSENVAVGHGTLGSNTTGGRNTAIGTWAMQAGDGSLRNTAVGYSSMLQSGGQDNSAFGAATLISNTTGSFNTVVGSNAMSRNTTGGSNAAVGDYALYNNTTGIKNTALGSGALDSTTTGARNTGVGEGALGDNHEGDRNVAVGSRAIFNSSGSDNIALGTDAGSNLVSGNSNIYIGHFGASNDTNLIRIGTTGTQTATFIAGIRDVTTNLNNAVNVVIDGNGQLGTISSSRDGKEDIADMSDASAALMQLRPVTFHYKADRDLAGRRLQYGLIAEEVADVYPGIVATKSGKVETIMYQYLAPMLLNEFQKQQRTIEAQGQALAAEREARAAQAREIAELKRAVQLLMARMGSGDRIAAK